jgi:D-alanine--poly(phosphoribitol) ligase subunit 1
VRELRAGAAALRVHRQINHTATPYPDHNTVQELFERCAKDFPERIAIVCGSESLTYSELNSLSNGFADQIARFGVGSGQCVAVYNERSLEMIVSLLAIIKCGAYYLSLDSSWPSKLLDGILSSFSCRLVLAGKRMPATAQLAAGDRVIRVDVGRIEPIVANPIVTSNAEATAYVTFTSGTTGTPKGVPIQHRSIARLVFAAVYAPVDHTSVLLHMSPVTFDAATFEIWGALLRGGTCVMYPSRWLSFSRLKKVIERSGVTVAFITTALFNAVMDEAPEALDTVATILTGGERYSYRHIAAALGRYGSGRVIHVYGPTECTTFATYYPIHGMPAAQDELPIGKPIQNTRVYVVNGESLCPPNVVGEIMLAGPGLSPGYLTTGQSDITAFLEYQIEDKAERVYRTGDYGYLLDSGDLVFTGRRDDQVKVNGFRIKLAELSQVLESHPNVRQSYVTVSEGAMGERLLSAFVVPLDGLTTTAEFRQYLRVRVPDYMIPSVIRCCERLPLTGSGKVDRQALLRWSQGLATPPVPASSDIRQDPLGS